MIISALVHPQPHRDSECTLLLFIFQTSIVSRQLKQSLIRHHIVPSTPVLVNLPGQTSAAQSFDNRLQRIPCLRQLSSLTLQKGFITIFSFSLYTNQPKCQVCACYRTHESMFTLVDACVHSCAYDYSCVRGKRLDRLCDTALRKVNVWECRCKDSNIKKME